MPDKRAASVALAAVAVVIVVPLSILAQAWTPPQGEGSFGLGYQNFYTRNHYFADETYDVGHIRTNSLGLDLTYGVTDRLAADVGIPFVVSKYEGASPHRPGGQIALDDGSYHGTFADYRFEVRYNAVQKPFFLTPFVGYVIPSHQYVYFSHSAPSRGLNEFQLGFNIGQRLDRLVPNTVAHLRYSFAFVEKVLGVSHNRSNVDLELGYFVTPSLTFEALGFYQRTHGGVDFPPLGTQAFRDFVNSPLWPHHDQLSRANVVDVGFRLDYALTGSIDVFAGYIWSVWGQNFHALQNGIMLGASWGFSPDRIVRSFFPKANPASARTEP